MSAGYLKQAQDSRDISEYAYRRGAASLLDFLDAERSYRATQLAYRQALASYMTAARAIESGGGNEESAMKRNSTKMFWRTGRLSACFCCCSAAARAPSSAPSGKELPKLHGAELFTIPQDQMSHVQIAHHAAHHAWIALSALPVRSPITISAPRR